MTTIFEGLRVVEFSQGMAGPLAGMLLADNGAQVTKVEPPAGDWARPYPGFLMWNRGKRSVVLDFSTPADLQAARTLAAEADVVIAAFAPGTAARRGLDYAPLRQLNPALVYATIEGIAGATGAGMRAYEGIVAARSGRMMGNDRLSGSVIDDPARPIWLAAPFNSYGAGMLAMQGIAAALYQRRRTGAGQEVRTSLLDGASAATMRLRFQRQGEAIVPVQVAPGRSLMLRGIALTFLTAECSDGRYIQMCARQDHHFRNWMTALGLAHLLGEPRFAGAPMQFQCEADVDELEVLLRERMRTKTQAEWMRIFIEEHDVGGDPFLTAQEFLDHEQMLANGRIVTIDDPDRGPVTQLGPLVLFSETPSVIRGSAPALGADTVPAVPARAPAVAVAPSAAPRPPPFSGITVLEVATFLAGPLGATLLAELGARVIKLEPPGGDPFRRTGLEFVHIVHGKESIAVDLKQAQGRAILQRLIASSDALLHNFRPDVPARLGMDYQSASRVNPRLVYLYAGSYGSKGPQRGRPAFHSTPNALCGGGIKQAGQGNVPVDDSYPDPCSGIAVGTALALGLYAREITGRGQYLETTMLCSSGYVHSNDLVRYRGAPPWQLSDRGQHGPSALCRLYRCATGWIFLCVVQRKEWQALAAGLGRPQWLADPRLSGWPLGTDAQAALESDLERIFAQRGAGEWVRALAGAGVAVASAADGTFEEFLAAEKMLAAEMHPSFGEYFRLPPRVRFSACENAHGAPSACGEHTDAILEELGYTHAQRAALHAQGVVRAAAAPSAVAAGAH
ncbi:MAG: CaiB/BaiF CoA transferase family protein [Gammaproteobacteria bacterium]